MGVVAFPRHLFCKAIAGRHRDIFVSWAVWVVTVAALAFSVRTLLVLAGSSCSDDMGLLFDCIALYARSGTGSLAAYRAFCYGGDVSVFAAGLLFYVYRDRPTWPDSFLCIASRQFLSQFCADKR